MHEYDHGRIVLWLHGIMAAKLTVSDGGAELRVADIGQVVTPRSVLRSNGGTPPLPLEVYALQADIVASLARPARVVFTLPLDFPAAGTLVPSDENAVQETGGR